MSQPTQVKFSLPENSFNVIDNSSASTTTTLAGPTNSSPIGFDTVAPATVPAGAQAQATNPYGDTGSTTLDTVNDTVYADPSCATFPGNPVSLTAPAFKTVTTALQNSIQGIRVLWKNPAIVIF